MEESLDVSELDLLSQAALYASPTPSSSQQLYQNGGASGQDRNRAVRPDRSCNATSSQQLYWNEGESGIILIEAAEPEHTYTQPTPSSFQQLYQNAEASEDGIMETVEPDSSCNVSSSQSQHLHWDEDTTAKPEHTHAQLIPKSSKQMRWSRGALGNDRNKAFESNRGCVPQSSQQLYWTEGESQIVLVEAAESVRPLGLTSSISLIKVVRKKKESGNNRIGTVESDRSCSTTGSLQLFQNGASEHNGTGVDEPEHPNTQSISTRFQQLSRIEREPENDMIEIDKLDRPTAHQLYQNKEKSGDEMIETAYLERSNAHQSPSLSQPLDRNEGTPGYVRTETATLHSSHLSPSPPAISSEATPPKTTTVYYCESHRLEEILVTVDSQFFNSQYLKFSFIKDDDVSVEAILDKNSKSLMTNESCFLDHVDGLIYNFEKVLHLDHCHRASVKHLTFLSNSLKFLCLKFAYFSEIRHETVQYSLVRKMTMKIHFLRTSMKKWKADRRTAPSDAVEKEITVLVNRIDRYSSTIASVLEDLYTETMTLNVLCHNVLLEWFDFNLALFRRIGNYDNFLESYADLMCDACVKLKNRSNNAEVVMLCNHLVCLECKNDTYENYFPHCPVCKEPVHVWTTIEQIKIARICKLQKIANKTSLVIHVE